MDTKKAVEAEILVLAANMLMGKATEGETKIF
jgi:hypothetical protein